MLGKVLLTLVLSAAWPSLSWACEPPPMEEHTDTKLEEGVSFPGLGASFKDNQGNYLDIRLGQSLGNFTDRLGPLKQERSGQITYHVAEKLGVQLTTPEDNTAIIGITLSQPGHKLKVLGHEIKVGDPGNAVSKALGMEHGWQRNKTPLPLYSAIEVYTELGLRFYITKDNKVGAIGIERPKEE